MRTPSPVPIDIEMEEYDDGEDNMDMDEGKKYKICKQEICTPSPKTDAKKMPSRTQKKKQDGALFLVRGPILSSLISRSF